MSCRHTQYAPGCGQTLLSPQGCESTLPATRTAAPRRDCVQKKIGHGSDLIGVVFGARTGTGVGEHPPLRFTRHRCCGISIFGRPWGGTRLSLAAARANGSQERETVSASLLKLALFCAVRTSVRTGRLGRTLHVRIVFSPSVFSTQRGPTVLRNAAEVHGLGPLCGHPAGKLPYSLYCYGGPVSPRVQQSLSLQHWEDLNTLAIFLVSLCSACVLLVDFIHCGNFPRPFNSKQWQGSAKYMQQQKISLSKPPFSDLPSCPEAKQSTASRYMKHFLGH